MLYAIVSLRGSTDPYGSGVCVCVGGGGGNLITPFDVQSVYETSMQYVL